MVDFQGSATSAGAPIAASAGDTGTMSDPGSSGNDTLFAGAGSGILVLSKAPAFRFDSADACGYHATGVIWTVMQRHGHTAALPPEDPGWPARTLAVRRATLRLCGQLGWAGLHEMPLPNGRRADILALRPDGGFACIEIKSGARDFLTDGKWPEYRDFSDALYFAIDSDFPQNLLPPDVGLIVAAAGEAALLREAPDHKLAPARRRALLHRFATLAALRLAALEDPAGAAAWRTDLRPD